MNREIEQYFTGSGIQHLIGIKLKNIILPLPPLAEQNALVERVQKLMAFVEKIETQVTGRKVQLELCYSFFL